MKTASINLEPSQLDPNRHVHQCNVCGNHSNWTDDHRHIERPVGKGYLGYEVYFVTCSDECRKIDRDIFITWLSGFEGWSKKTAAENYDNYIIRNHDKEDFS